MELPQDLTPTEYDPAKNPNAISIIRQPDGNYIGKASKWGMVVEVRQGDPHTVLSMLIAHDGTPQVKEE